MRVHDSPSSFFLSLSLPFWYASVEPSSARSRIKIVPFWSTSLTGLSLTCYFPFPNYLPPYLTLNLPTYDSIQLLSLLPFSVLIPTPISMGISWDRCYGTLFLYRNIWVKTRMKKIDRNKMLDSSYIETVLKVTNK